MDDILSEKVIGAAFRVHSRLGFGFLESVYEKSLAIEFGKIGVSFERQALIKVYYEKIVVGEFCCDFLIDEKLIVELKSVVKLVQSHEVQLVNYLTATDTEVGLLINFGPKKVDVKRKFRTYRPRLEREQRSE